MPSALKITKLDHVVLRVRDLESMIGFYCNVLGCSLERRSSAVEGLVHLRAGDSLIDLMAGAREIGPENARSENMDHLCVQVEPYDEAELTAYLEARGVEVGEFDRRFGSDGYGQSVYIRDPEGNEVELKAPPAPG